MLDRFVRNNTCMEVKMLDRFVRTKTCMEV